MFPYGYKEEEPQDLFDHRSDTEQVIGDQVPNSTASRWNIAQSGGHLESDDKHLRTGSRGTLVEEDGQGIIEKEGADGRDFDKKSSTHITVSELPEGQTPARRSDEHIYESGPSTPCVGAQHLDDDEKFTNILRVTSRRSVRSVATTRSNRSGATVKPVQSIDKEGNVYPEGGREAYSVVIGAFMAMFGSLGLVNSTGIFQSYLLQHQLSDQSESKVGWIFGMFAFFMFFSSLQIGPIFDAKGPRELMLLGTALIVGGTLALGWCTKYAHFMVVFAFMIGPGNSLVFNPAVASISHYFLRNRARATGIATSGGGIGGVVFPLMLQSLFPKIGWAWSTRAVALLCLVTLAIGCLLVKSRLPKKKATKENILPDFRIFKQPIFTTVTMGIFFLEWGMFIPVTYISSYAFSHGVSEKLSYQILALLNVGSALGRFIPGFIADSIGRFNTMIITAVLCFLTNFVLWFPAASHTALIIVFAIAFGFASGSNMSLVAVCIGQICKTENYGRYYATSYCLVSFAYVITFPLHPPLLVRVQLTH